VFGRRTPPPASAGRPRDPGGPPDDWALGRPAGMPGPFWAKITGQTSDTNRYAWTQANDGDPPDFSATYADDFAASGTSEVGGAPAYEVNGLTTVPADTRVLLWPAGDLTYYLFEYATPAAPAATTALSSCAWPAGITTDECVEMTVASATGRCADIDTTQDIFLAWDAGAAKWQSGAADWTGTGSGGTGQVTFSTTTPVPTATIDAVAGTYLGCDGTGGILFGFGGAVLCGGTDGDCDNFFVARFACSCCPIAGWDGEGWYCVRAAGSSAACEAQELLAADKCDATIEICSGHYASQSAALVVCGSTPLTITCNSVDYHFLRQYRLEIGEQTPGSGQDAHGDCILTYDPDVSPDGSGWYYWYGDNDDFRIGPLAPCAGSFGSGGTMSWAVRVRCSGGFLEEEISCICGVVAHPNGPWTSLGGGLESPTYAASIGDPGYSVSTQAGCGAYCAVSVDIREP
jgi:hypothetical protein